MFIVKINYLVDINEVEKYVKSHRDFLDIYYKQGVFLLSGPMNPRTGGIIVAKGTDRDELEEILTRDPYALAGIAKYELIEFSAVKYCDEISSLI